MAWNQPGNNGQDNDPWGNKKKKESSNNSSDFLNKMNDLLKKQTNNSGSNGSNRSSQPGSISIQPKWIVILIILVILAIWIFSGIHTINQSERGVVTRFGKVQNELAMPGLNWYPPLIDKVYLVDTQGTRSINVKGYMITAGENLVYVEMNVQYRISDPKKYLFNVTNVTDSLIQAADSALRSEVGTTNMDAILSDGRALIELKTKALLNSTIENYDMGLRIIDLNFQTASPPDEVKAAYNDAIKAREDKVRETNKAEADSVQYIQEAEGKSARILAEANAYKISVEYEAEGDIERFERLLPEYRLAPTITKERLYIEMMEKVLSKTKKIIINENSNNVMVLPLDKLGTAAPSASSDAAVSTASQQFSSSSVKSSNTSTNTDNSSSQSARQQAADRNGRK